MAQMAKLLELPALGSGVVVTTTWLVAAGQGAVPDTVYVYVPGAMVPASKSWLTTGLGPFHMPPLVGVPPKASKRFDGAWPRHMVIAPLLPALGALCTVTNTVVLLLGHGGGTLIA